MDSVIHVNRMRTFTFHLFSTDLDFIVLRYKRVFWRTTTQTLNIIMCKVWKLGRLQQLLISTLKLKVHNIKIKNYTRYAK